MPGNFKAQEKPRAPRLGCEIKRRGRVQREGLRAGPWGKRVAPWPQQPVRLPWMSASPGQHRPASGRAQIASSFKAARNTAPDLRSWSSENVSL